MTAVKVLVAALDNAAGLFVVRAGCVLGERIVVEVDHGGFGFFHSFCDVAIVLDGFEDLHHLEHACANVALASLLGVAGVRAEQGWLHREES